MTRKRVLVLLTVILLVLGTGGAGAAYAFLKMRGQGARERAEVAYAAQDWATAKREYQWYLARHPDDLAALARYAEAGSKLLDNRYAVLRDVANAYFRLASEADPRDPEAERFAVRFAQDHLLWAQLEYMAGFFLRRDPDNMEFRFAKALASDRLGRYNEAAAEYERLISTGEAPWEAYGNLAVLLRTQDRTEQALARLEEAVQRDPASAGPLIERGRYFLTGGDAARARSDAEAALALSPGDGQALLLSAQVAAAEARWDGAIAAARKAIEADATLVNAHLVLASAYQQSDAAEKAEETLLAVDPTLRANRPELFMALAEAQVGLAKYDALEETLTSYRKSYPDHGPILDYLSARAFLRQGRPQEAVEKLKVVTVSTPDFLPAQFYLAVAYLGAAQQAAGGDRPALEGLARATLESYLRNNPSDTAATQLMARLNAGSATFEEASAAARAALEKPSATAGELVVAAQSLLGTRNEKNQAEVWALAERVLRKAIELDPRTPESANMLAAVLIDAGRNDEAQAVLDAAAEVGVPSNELALMSASRAMASGDLERAKSLAVDVLSAEGVSAAIAARWAELFARNGQAAEGIRILDEAGARMSEAGHAELLAQKVALCLRVGDMDQAQAVIRTLEAGASATPAEADALNRAKLSLADALARTPDTRPQAAALTDEVLQADPENGAARQFRARLYLMDDPPQVAKAEELLAGTAPEAAGADALLLQADIAGRRGHWSKAADLAQRALSLDPGNVAGRLALAEAQWRSQRLPEARATLERLTADQPNNLAAVDLLAKVYAAGGSRDQARALITRLEEAARQQPELAAAVEATSAWVALYDRRWADAEGYFHRQVEARPEDAGARQAWALALGGLGRTADAEAALRDGIDRSQGSPEAWVSLGRFYLSGEDPDKLTKASTAFTRALSKQRDFTPALLGLLEVQLRSGRPGAATALCDQFLARQPEDADVLYQKARLLAGVPGKREEALGAVRQAIAISDRPEFSQFRALLYLDGKQYREALQDLQKMAQTPGGTVPDFDLAMAEAYHGVGDEDVARRYYELAKQKSNAGEPVNADRLAAMARIFDPQPQEGQP